jgi:hypothetical protein
LAQNRLESLPPLRGLVALEGLYAFFFPVLFLISHVSMFPLVPISLYHFQSRSIQYLPNLDRNLRNNFIEVAPSQLQNSVNLRNLYVYASPWDLPSFRDLGYNSISSKFPDWVLTFKSLEYLDLSGNSFYGTLPSGLASLSRITIL